MTRGVARREAAVERERAPGFIVRFAAYALSWIAFWILILFVVPLVLVLLFLITGETY